MVFSSSLCFPYQWYEDDDEEKAEGHQTKSQSQTRMNYYARKQDLDQATRYGYKNGEDYKKGGSWERVPGGQDEQQFHGYYAHNTQDDRSWGMQV